MTPREYAEESRDVSRTTTRLEKALEGFDHRAARREVRRLGRSLGWAEVADVL